MEILECFRCDFPENRAGDCAAVLLWLRIDEGHKQDEFRIVSRGESDEGCDDFACVIVFGGGVPDFRCPRLAGDRVAFDGGPFGGSVWGDDGLEGFDHLFRCKMVDRNLLDTWDGTDDRAVGPDDMIDDVGLHHDTAVGDGAVCLDHLEGRDRNALADGEARDGESVPAFTWAEDAGGFFLEGHCRSVQRIEADASPLAESEGVQALVEIVGSHGDGGLGSADVAGVHDDFRDGEVFVVVGVMESGLAPESSFAVEDGVDVEKALRDAAGERDAFHDGAWLEGFREAEESEGICILNFVTSVWVECGALGQCHDGSCPWVHHHDVCAVWIDGGEGFCKILFSETLDVTVDGEEDVAAVGRGDELVILLAGKREGVSFAVFCGDDFAVFWLEYVVKELFDA